MTAKSAFLIIAAFCTSYATVSLAAGFDADFNVSAAVAVICLAAVFYLDHRAYERERAAHVRDDWLHDWELADSGFDESLREVD
jgi:hypothetical protein